MPNEKPVPHARAVAYPDKEIALVMVEEMARQRNGKSRKQWRVEKCEECQGWHVRDEIRGGYLRKS